MTDDVILMASGGMDSTTLGYWLAEKAIDFVPLFIDYGQHCSATELGTLRKVLPSGAANRLVIINVSDVYKGSESRLIKEADLWREEVHYSELYLPYRSLLLLSTGSAFAQSHGHRKIYAGFINSNHAQEIDCSTEFFLKLADLFADYGGVQIEMPFRTWSKYEVAMEGIRLGAPIAATFSCQVSSVVPCGACPNCVDRLHALKTIVGGGEK